RPRPLHHAHAYGLLSLLTPPPHSSTLFPYTTLFRSHKGKHERGHYAEDRLNFNREKRLKRIAFHNIAGDRLDQRRKCGTADKERDRKSTRLNSSHVSISYAVFCLKKKKKKQYLAESG